MTSIMNALQSLGRALMLPIAVLPIAGLLLRLGQPDLLNIAFLNAAGAALFSHLGMLFAIGVATAYARDGNGASALAGIVCFLVAKEGGQALLTVPHDVIAGATAQSVDALSNAWKETALAKLDVPLGIMSGLVGGLTYNRVIDLEVPAYLAFFGGRRLASIVSGVIGICIALIVGLSFEAISSGIDALSRVISSSGIVGLFLYGLLNRLLLITGLHHILNNVAWFVIGDYHGATGDLRRFFAGDPHAGGFMSGFFPVMIFGLPAAALAMYRSVPAERRQETAGLFLSLGLTSALTGVTEPIEFSFMFVAPALYAIHALLTAIAMVVMSLLGVHLGFTFSAGLFDYGLSFGRSTRPLMLLPIGLLYAALYYAIFRYAIERFDLATPGRKTSDLPGGGLEPAMENSRGAAFVVALGGARNMVSIEACTTRLRLVVMDSTSIDEQRLKQLGAIGLLRPAANSVQVVLGPIADRVASEIREACGALTLQPQSEPSEATGGKLDLPAELVGPLGSASNIVRCEVFRRRLLLTVKDAAALDRDALAGLGMRHIDQQGDRLHLLFRDDFPSVAAYDAT